MLDPITAFSLAGTVAQFLEISARIISTTNEIRDSATGSTEANSELWKLTEHLCDQVEKLSRPLHLRDVAGCLSKDDTEFEDFCSACRQVGTELLSTLAHVRSQKKGKWTSLSTALKAAWKAKDIGRVEKRLQGMKATLNTDILFKLRDNMDSSQLEQSERFRCLEAKTQQILEALCGERESPDGLMDRIRTITKMLNQTEVVVRQQQQEHHKTRRLIVDLLQKPGDGQAPFGSLDKARGKKRLQNARLAENLKVQRVDARVMQRLHSVTRDDRKDTIAEAHQRTFQWLHTEDISVPRPWSSFKEWLRHDGKVYWINGKAGSGKSTLMKFIYQDPRTHEELVKWADGQTLITASHFFWNSGTVEQRSQAGLIQSLVQQILEQEPALIPITFPSLWANEYLRDRKENTIELRAEGQLHPLSLHELYAGFRRLLTQKSIAVSICIFVDGLDEYEGDQTDMAKLMIKCSDLPNIKFCVSSRLLIPLEDAFQGFPKLQLQDLTYDDIKSYVTDKLNDNKRFELLASREPESSSALIDDIVSTANGVFLWVRLAVQALLEGFANHDTLSDLKRRLRLIPTELVGLYEHMLERIDPFYQARSARLFQMVYTSQSQYPHLAPMVQLGLANVSFALDFDDQCDPSNTFSSSDAFTATRLSHIADQVRICSAGLLECHSDPQFNNESIIRYIHWTAREYLESNKVAQRFRDILHGSDFNPNVAFVNSCVHDLALCTYGPQFWQLIITIMWHSYKANSTNDSRYVTVLDNLDQTATRLYHAHYGVAETGKAMPHWTNHEPCRKEDEGDNFAESVHSKSDFLSFAVKFGLTLYVKSKLGRDDRILKSKKGRPYLDYAIHRPCEDMRYKLNPDMVALLFQRGARANDIYEGQSCWQNAIRAVEMLSSMRSVSNADVIRWIQIFELFLEYGAHANERISVGAEHEKQTALSVVTDTLLEWEPLQAAKLHQMLVAGGATMSSTALQRQTDSIETVIASTKIAAGMAVGVATQAVVNGQNKLQDLQDRCNSARRKVLRWTGLSSWTKSRSPNSKATENVEIEDTNFPGLPSVQATEMVKVAEWNSSSEEQPWSAFMCLQRTCQRETITEAEILEILGYCEPEESSLTKYTPFFNVRYGGLSALPLSRQDYLLFRRIAMGLAMPGYFGLRRINNFLLEANWSLVRCWFLRLRNHHKRVALRHFVGANLSLVEDSVGRFLGAWPTPRRRRQRQD